MSFWGGMARGFKDASEKKERDQAVARQQERLSIEDERYTSETERADRYRSEDVAFRTQGFKAQQEQLAHQRKMSEQAESRAEESFELDRYKTLMAAMPTGLSSSLGGGVSSKGGPKVMSTEAITEGATIYHNEYQNLSEEAKDSEFFKMLKGDAGVQASMMGFIAAQAEKGNTVNLEDLPKYFKYAGTIEGQGEAEAQKALEMLTTGEGITDTKSFAKGLVAFKNYKPTKHLFQQIGTPPKLDDLDKQVTFWADSTETEAYRMVDSLPDGKRQEVRQALALMEQKPTRIKGLSTLAKLGFGRTVAEKHNMMDNSTIGAFYPSEETPVVNVEAAAGGDADAAPRTPVEAPKSTVEGQVFNSWTEVEEARNNGFSGAATVGGTTYDVAPIEAPDGLTQSSVETGAGQRDVDESGFRTGSDNSLKPVADLDALFNEVLTEGAQPPTEVPDNRRVPERDLTTEEMKGGIEGALKGDALDEKVAAVEEELFDIGIYKPTNEQELEYFKEDLNILISDLEIPIPPEVLKGVVENVIARVMYKAESPKDYPSKPIVKQRSGTSKPVTPSGRKASSPNELNRGEKARLSRALRSGDEGILRNLYEEFGEDTINKTREELGL